MSGCYTIYDLLTTFNGFLGLPLIIELDCELLIGLACRSVFNTEEGREWLN